MILNELAAAARKRVVAAKLAEPLDNVRAYAEEMPVPCDFQAALNAPGLSLICEVKRASPSKGMISPDFPYLRIAGEYESAGASAISVLTEPTRFLGKNEYLAEIAANAKIPCLRKDFTVDEYQIYEAKTLGASAILLICAILSDAELLMFRKTAERIGMSALVEAHTESEVKRAIDCGAKIIGVNNRDLHTFDVDITIAKRLRKLIPANVLYVAESGVTSPSDGEELKKYKADAVLVGEALMKASDRAAFISNIRRAYDKN